MTGRPALGAAAQYAAGGVRERIEAACALPERISMR